MFYITCNTYCWNTFSVQNGTRILDMLNSCQPRWALACFRACPTVFFILTRYIFGFFFFFLTTYFGFWNATGLILVHFFFFFFYIVYIAIIVARNPNNAYQRGRQLWWDAKFSIPKYFVVRFFRCHNKLSKN